MSLYYEETTGLSTQANPEAAIRERFLESARHQREISLHELDHNYPREFLARRTGNTHIPRLVFKHPDGNKAIHIHAIQKLPHWPEHTMSDRKKTYVNIMLVYEKDGQTGVIVQFGDVVINLYFVSNSDIIIAQSLKSLHVEALSETMEQIGSIVPGIWFSFIPGDYRLSFADQFLEMRILPRRQHKKPAGQILNTMPDEAADSSSALGSMTTNNDSDPVPEPKHRFWTWFGR